MCTGCINLSELFCKHDWVGYCSTSYSPHWQKQWSQIAQTCSVAHRQVKMAWPWLQYHYQSYHHHLCFCSLDSKKKGRTECKWNCGRGESNGLGCLQIQGAMPPTHLPHTLEGFLPTYPMTSLSLCHSVVHMFCRGANGQVPGNVLALAVALCRALWIGLFFWNLPFTYFITMKIVKNLIS